MKAYVKTVKNADGGYVTQYVTKLEPCCHRGWYDVISGDISTIQDNGFYTDTRMVKHCDWCGAKFEIIKVEEESNV